MLIGRYLVLSTSHIRCATAELLEGWARLPATEQPLMVASTQCGWFVASRRQQADRMAQLPKELPPILALALALDCTYVLFDCDGPEETMLPVFPW